MAYLDPKGEGDSSMPEKQSLVPRRRGEALRARAIWRKLDCLNPNLQRCKSTSIGKTPETDAASCADSIMVCRRNLRERGAIPNEGI